MITSKDVTILKEFLLVLEQRVSQELGGFALFALIKRDDDYGDWDLVVSAPWVKDERDLMELISIELNKNLVLQDWGMLSRIVVLSPDEPFVAAINKLVDVEHANDVSITNRQVIHVPIEDSYIITSKPLAVAA